MFVSRERIYCSSCEEEQSEREHKMGSISLISELSGLLEMNAAFLWKVIVLVCNMAPQHRAYIHNTP
jgi:hypothetical protein